MTTQEKSVAPARVNDDRAAVERAALQAVLGSRTFDSTPRLASLLQYICDRYFEGGTDTIKEYSIATDVFRRPSSFDQATDSIVRVEVFRLRKKLREFYDGEGADQPLEIVIATGHYRPEFIERLPGGRQQSQEKIRDDAGEGGPPSGLQKFGLEELSGIHLPAGDQGGNQAGNQAGNQGDPWSLRSATADSSRRRAMFLKSGLILTIGVAAALIWWTKRPHPVAQESAPQPSTALTAAAGSGPEVRIRCGYSRPMFKDNEGNNWTGDRYYSGGFVTELPTQPIARTRNPELYLTARSGVFSYKIPLAAGSYELRLYFAETTYSPASTLGGGENSRVFDVQLNGRSLLTQFDIVNDAGPNTADVRVFRDVTPDKDGYLHLEFTGSLGLPLINAIEILPGLPHRLRPIRMVAQNSFFVDKSGNLWMPDTYFSSGRIASDKLAIGGTTEPGLFSGERYGNFSYALPVDAGTYKLTLYLSEKYWGGVSKAGGIGSRVFDVLCNGTALTRRLDIFKEAGAGNAYVKVYHGLHPNAQGKLIVSFVPDVNYASIDAIEVEQEDSSD